MTSEWSKAQRERLMIGSNGSNPARNACTAAVVARMCGIEHLSGRYLHTVRDTLRALQADGYSTRSMMTAFKRNVRCKSGLRVQQVTTAMKKVAQSFWDQGSWDTDYWLLAACKPGEMLNGIVYFTTGHVGCVDHQGVITDTAWMPNAKVTKVYGLYYGGKA